MGSVTFEIAIVLLLIVVNGVFSMSELAVVSARKNRLQERADEGNQGAETALDLAANPNRFLSTVQIGITLIGILSGALGGATVAEEIGKSLAAFPVLVPYSEGIGVGIVVVVITYLSLVIGELVPKRLALNNAEGIAVRVAQAMKWLSFITTPVVALLSISTDLVLRILGAKPSQEPAVTEEDVQSMISQGTQLGIFEETEQEMVRQVFRLGERRISSVMTPRPDITFIDADDPSDEILQVISGSGYSRFPVFADTVDNILGILHIKDLFQRSITGEPLDIRTVLRIPLYIPEANTALEVLERMKQTGSEMTFIIDEYGGLMGLVTLNDIMEAIVGDVQLPETNDEPEIVRRADGSYLMGGKLLVDELKQILNINDVLPNEERGYYETLGGMLMSELGRIPLVGDIYDWDGFRFEVVDMDGLRVDKVLVIQKEV